jgi:hypothetical protein
MKLNLGIAIAIIAIACGLAQSVRSQSTISEEKSRLIGEIATVMELDKQFPLIMDSMLKEMDKTYPMSFDAVVDAHPSLTPGDKAALKASVSDRYKAFSEKFRKRLSERVDYGRYIREAIYPLYDKFYTEHELKDLLVFYATPTGKKMIKTMPAVFAESNRLASEKFVPQLIPIVEELMREEFESIGAPAPKPVSN